ncbi:MAG: linear amide C-N hydrolase [Candidatus Marinimicrobia bacterium]|nr:linear amide C-N hydrolase [Candidatus Neomarinimicrobiota bacterium]
MEKYLRPIIFSLAIAINIPPGQACTVFCLQDSAAIFVGKNLDWPIPIGIAFYNPSGARKQSVNARDGNASWEAVYSSVTANQFGRNMPLGGMNSAGLVIESTAYSLSCYPDQNQALVLSEFEWIQYHLDMYRSVNEVIESAQSIAPHKWIIELHYLIIDAQGNVAYLEWLGGKLNVFTGKDLPVAAQSNNSYQNSIKYLKAHKGFGGQRNETNSAASQERFVRAARFLKETHSANKKTAFQGLEIVKQHDTQWSLVYDSIRRTLHIVTHDSSPNRLIKLDELEKEHGSQTAMCILKDRSGDPGDNFFFALRSEARSNRHQICLRSTCWFGRSES